MPQLWLLKGAYEAPGWKDLERDSKAGEVDVVMFDRLAWAMLEADEAPKGYEGLEPSATDHRSLHKPGGESTLRRRW
jgi:hypothetical protein